MKKAMVISLTVVIGLFLTGAAYAMWGGYGSSPCITATGADIETVKKFQKETLSLRDEIMTKKLELHSEYNKPTPDTNRIATIQKEIIDLKAKIHEIANKHGIKVPAGQGMTGRGMMGKGHGMMGKMKGMGNPCPMSQQ
jgi:zinc resistance-associated protein